MSPTETATVTGRCLWCDKVLDPPQNDRGQDRLYCNDAHRARFKRAEKAATWAELVQSLEPHVKPTGRRIYKEMVDRLAGSLNEAAVP